VSIVPASPGFTAGASLCQRNGRACSNQDNPRCTPVNRPYVFIVVLFSCFPHDPAWIDAKFLSSRRSRRIVRGRHLAFREMPKRFSFLALQANKWEKTAAHIWLSEAERCARHVTFQWDMHIVASVPFRASIRCGASHRSSCEVANMWKENVIDIRPKAARGSTCGPSSVR